MATSLICSVGLGFLGGYLLRPTAVKTEAAGENSTSRQVTRDSSASSLSARSTTVPRNDQRAQIDINEMDDDQLRQSFREIIGEPNWVKKEAAFLSILAEADLAQAQRIYRVLGDLYAQGWDTNALHSRAKMREGMLMGEAGMDEMPAEPNGMPAYPMREKMRGWASADPAAGWKWLQSLEPGQAQGIMMTEWTKGVQIADPSLLESLVPNLPEQLQGQIMGKIVSGAIEKEGLAGLPKWYEQFSKNASERLKSTAFEQAINRYGQSPSDWKNAVEFMKGATEPGDALFANGLQQLVWRGAKWDPNGTLDLLAEYLPQNDHLAAGRDRYIRETINWASSESALVVGEWLDENQGSVIYDDVASRYVQQMKSLDSEAARAWAESIQNAELKESALESLSE